MSQRKMYLGDSVYVDVEDGMLKLTTENGLATGPSNVIYLEPQVYRALTQYATRHGIDDPVAHFVNATMDNLDTYLSPEEARDRARDEQARLAHEEDHRDEPNEQDHTTPAGGDE